MAILGRAAWALNWSVTHCGVLGDIVSPLVSPDFLHRISRSGEGNCEPFVQSPQASPWTCRKDPRAAKSARRMRQICCRAGGAVPVLRSRRRRGVPGASGGPGEHLRAALLLIALIPAIPTGP